MSLTPVTIPFKKGWFYDGEIWCWSLLELKGLINAGLRSPLPAAMLKFIRERNYDVTLIFMYMM